jgi:hypothetical protein
MEWMTAITFLPIAAKIDLIFLKIRNMIFRYRGKLSRYKVK